MEWIIPLKKSLKSWFYQLETECSGTLRATLTAFHINYNHHQNRTANEMYCKANKKTVAHAVESIQQVLKANYLWSYVFKAREGQPAVNKTWLSSHSNLKLVKDNQGYDGLAGWGRFGQMSERQIITVNTLFLSVRPPYSLMQQGKQKHIIPLHDHEELTFQTLNTYTFSSIFHFLNIRFPWKLQIPVGYACRGAITFPFSKSWITV